MKKVIIEVAPDGSTKVDAQGFAGNSCTMATRDIELALAGSPANVEDRKKPDFYQGIGSTAKQSN